MTNTAFTRRKSYGPTSPTVGSRGAQTRREIAEAALQCFAQHGFHATAVEDIAVLADVSRATLYQYFESKSEIFVELMYESGGHLLQLTRELERLGADVDGFRNLARWVDDWSANFDRFAPMFIEWTNVASPKFALRPKLTRFVDLHTEHVSGVLTASGFQSGDPAAASILALALMSRFNYIRHVYRPGVTDERLRANLATALQLFLFPETPTSVLNVELEDSASRRDAELRPTADIGPLATLRPRDSIDRPTPFEGLSPQAEQTARRLLHAAGRVFAANGYEGANVDQVVGEAGLARGTFYRYFSGKLALIIALADEAAAKMCPLFDDYEVAAIARDPAGLRDWLGRFLAVQREYAGVMRAWTEGFPIDPVVLAPAAEVTTAMGKAIIATFGPKRPYPLDRRVAGMLLTSVLEHFPNQGVGAKHEPSTQLIVETQANFIERVLLPN